MKRGSFVLIIRTSLSDSNNRIIGTLNLYDKDRRESFSITESVRKHSDDFYNIKIGIFTILFKILKRLSEEKVKNFCEKIHLIESKEENLKKEAELNEYIKIISPIDSHGAYKKGDIFKVIFKSDSLKTKGYVKVDKIPNPILHQEYMVLRNYKGE